MNTHRVSAKEKLTALQHSNSFLHWTSLDEMSMCVLCEKTFSGRRVRATQDRLKRITLRCPTPGCNGTPDEWVRPGNPLLCDKAWRDWKRMLNGLQEPGRLGALGHRRNRAVAGQMPD